MNDIAIGIYDKEGFIVTIVDTIEEASRWIGTGTSTLYDSLHREGVMKAKGYTVERVNLNYEEKENE